MANYGLLFPIFGVAGASVWFAWDTIDGLRRGRYDRYPLGSVSRRTRPRLFRFITLLRGLIIVVSVAGALWFVWLAWERCLRGVTADALTPLQLPDAPVADASAAARSIATTFRLGRWPTSRISPASIRSR